jgi:S1-C subfamily serine protease
MVEALLLAVTRITTITGQKSRSNATGFFFERDGRLFLVTSRHVVRDEASKHKPDSLEIELHVDPANVAETTGFGIPLYERNAAVWREATDDAGLVDVVAIELDRIALPATLLHRAFTPEHLVKHLDDVEAGTSVLIAGFPLGFHDTLHHLPVVRQAVIASSFGIRFQGSGYFLTDARMHRGTSGAPVVVRVSVPEGREDLSWKLLGIHGARMDVTNRDVEQDERLDLNCAWYADVLLVLTEAR